MTGSTGWMFGGYSLRWIIWRLKRIIALAVVGVAISGAPAGAQTGTSSGPAKPGQMVRKSVTFPGATGGLRLPEKGAKNAGFDCQIRWADVRTVGYQPVEITITAVGTFARDREWLFRFRGAEGSIAPASEDIVVDCRLAVKQNTKSQTFVRYLPQWAMISAVKVDLFEDGDAIAGYSGLMAEAASMGPVAMLPNAITAAETEGHFLILADKKSETFSESHLPSLLTSWPGVSKSNSHPETLPDDWRGLGAYTCVTIDQGTIEGWLQREAPAAGALRTWIMMGGCLIVENAQEPSEVMPQLQFSVNHPEAASRVFAHAMTRDPQYAGAVRRQLEAILASNSQSETPDGLVPEVPYVASLRQHCWVQAAGMGRVIGIRSVNNGANRPIQPAEMGAIQEMIRRRVSPTLRRGVDPLIGDSRFDNWLVPGVARPPVYMFMGMLTVFVVLVGPVAYRQTSRHHRSHLMFVIAPLLAILTTILLFGYGAIADGFGTKARIRQLTVVDGLSGDGVERIRSVYFAGIRPSQGVWFGPESEVMPYRQNTQSLESKLRSRRRMLGRVTLSERGQHFDSAFIASRRQASFVVHRPQRGIGRLSVVADPDGGWTVENQFGFALRQVIFRSSAGVNYSVPQLLPGQTAAATALTDSEASEMIGDAYNDYRPVAETTPNRSRRKRTGTYDVIRLVAQNLNSSASEVNGLFEDELTRQLQTFGRLPKGNFLALADPSEDAVVIEDAQVLSSVRYLFGTFALDQGGDPTAIEQASESEPPAGSKTRQEKSVNE